MSPRAQQEPLVVIAGPTAAGKTSAAIELALRFDGEIVNADSMQVYRGMDIGTAKPGGAERARVPHHLIDIVAPNEPYHAARFAAEAAARTPAGSARTATPTACVATKPGRTSATSFSPGCSS